MSLTTFSTSFAATKKAFSKKVFLQAINETPIANLLGDGKLRDSAIYRFTDLKEAGDLVNYQLLQNLQNNGFTEGQTAIGNEEAQTYFTDSVKINELLYTVSVPGKGSIDDQRVVFNAYEQAMPQLKKKVAQAIEYGAMNQMAGNTAQTNTTLTGMNAVTAVDTAHIVRPGGITADESITSANPFKLSVIHTLIRQAELSNPPIERIPFAGGKYYFLFLHPYQVEDLRNDTTSGGANFYDYNKAKVTGGDFNGPLRTGYLGEYMGVMMFSSNYLPQGLNSGSGVAVANTRRAVFMGLGAASLAFGKLTDGTEFELRETVKDYGRQIGVASYMVWGLKRNIFNSNTYGNLVLTTYTAG